MYDPVSEEGQTAGYDGDGPVGLELDVDVHDDGRVVLRHGDELIGEAEAATLDLDVPPVPGIEQPPAAAPADVADRPTDGEADR